MKDLLILLDTKVVLPVATAPEIDRTMYQSHAIQRLTLTNLERASGLTESLRDVCREYALPGTLGVI